MKDRKYSKCSVIRKEDANRYFQQKKNRWETVRKKETDSRQIEVYHKNCFECDALCEGDGGGMSGGLSTPIINWRTEVRSYSNLWFLISYDLTTCEHPLSFKEELTSQLSEEQEDKNSSDREKKKKEICRSRLNEGQNEEDEAWEVHWEFRV